MNYRSGGPAAVASLLAGATGWGLIWYPYRQLEAAGLSGPTATTLTYALALVVAFVFLRRRLRGARVDGWLVAIALATGGCNLGYVLAMLRGEVMRVLLLFYLAPLWTVLLSRLLLGERLARAGVVTIGMSVAGAAVMLWRPRMGIPWPATGAEWLGLSAGFLFALSNVLIRRADHSSIEVKTAAVFAGVVAIGLLSMIWEAQPTKIPDGIGIWLTVGALGVVLLLVNLAVQYGLTRIAANRAVVILLFELVVAAIASWWLAGEAMGPREWLGGGLIVVATLVSGNLGRDEAP